MQLDELFETPFKFGTFNAAGIVFSFARLREFVCTRTVYASGLEPRPVWCR